MILVPHVAVSATFVGLLTSCVLKARTMTMTFATRPERLQGAAQAWSSVVGAEGRAQMASRQSNESHAACGLSFPHAPHLWFDGDHDHAPDRICPGTTASADVDYRAAWEAAAKVVVAVGRFVEAERDGTPALIEDAHFGLLKALTDYRAGAK